MTREQQVGAGFGAAVLLVLATVVGNAVVPDDPPGEPLVLLTSDWDGGSGSDMLLTATLVRTDDCVYADTEAGPVDVVWPAGYRATVLDGSAVVWHDARAVVREGQTFSAGGGFNPIEGYALSGRPCAETRELVPFQVQSEVQVVD